MWDPQQHYPCKLCGGKAQWFNIRFLYMKTGVLELLLCLVVFTNCSSSKQELPGGIGHYSKDVFENEYFSSGNFRDESVDSVESGVWMISGLTTPVVLYGNYANGLPSGDWKLVINDQVLSSLWSRYEIAAKKCSFSLPFQYRENKLDSNYFKLLTNNDSIGNVSIIIGVDGIPNKELNLPVFVENFEVNLRKQHYSFSKRSRELETSGEHYFFNEYSLKDTMSKTYELYHFFGYTPSKKHFLELMLFHNGPKKELVEIVYSMFSMNFYIDNERFFNPFVKKGT
ncbi:MAG: hypothetical protein J0I41_20850 [Filimonas sp.]|nr:hypothetical protein [Filimonas sp.]